MNDEEFQLKVDCKDQNTYDIKENKKNNTLQTICLMILHMFDQLIQTDYFSFKLLKTPYFNKNTYEGDNSFHLNIIL